MKKIGKIILFVIIGLVVLATFKFLWDKSRPKVTVYNIETVSRGNIEKRTVATGRMNPRNEILIKPQMSGIISEVHKEAGEKVQAGDIIATIQVVPDMVNLSNAESRVSRAQIAADQSRSNYERDRRLYENQVISREEFERVQLEYRNSQEELRAANDNLSLVRTGITQSTARMSNTLVRSTVSGTILDVPIRVGNSVIQANNFNDGTTVASVADLSDMLFVGRIDETEVGRLSVPMPMEITIGAMPDRKVPASLEYIAPKGLQEGGAVLFEIKAALEVPEDVFIRAGFSANADIILDKRTDVLTIPESTLTFNGDSAFVFIVTNENPQEFERRQVQIGLSDGIHIEVTSGLSLDEKVRGTEIVGNRR
jgi:HlyD family secretion protein